MSDSVAVPVQQDEAEVHIYKVRKPYTITKQRERWTEEEHQKFLEALKLYGRAWRHIAEHIGAKTAVQIRSHAQKFFSKIEKEDSAGLPEGSALKFDIPPPRPKRKPKHPYPRKAKLSLSVSSTVGEGIRSPSLMPMSNPSTILSGPSTSEASCKGAAFSQYITKLGSTPTCSMLLGGPESSAMASSMKLFGQTVDAPTASMVSDLGSMLSSFEKSFSSETECIKANLDGETSVFPSCDVSVETGRDSVSLQKSIRLSHGKASNSRSNDNFSALEISQISSSDSVAVGEYSITTKSCMKPQDKGSEALKIDCSSDDFETEDLEKLPRSNSQESTAPSECTSPCSRQNPANYPQSQIYHGKASGLDVYQQCPCTTAQHLAAPFHLAVQKEFTPLQSSLPFSLMGLSDFGPGGCFTGCNGESVCQHENQHNPTLTPDLMMPQGPGSSFTAWQLSHAATFNSSTALAATTAAATFWPGLVLGAQTMGLPVSLGFPFNYNRSSVEDGGTDAVAAAAAVSFAATSAWWALHGAIPPAIFHPGRSSIFQDYPAMKPTVGVRAHNPDISTEIATSSTDAYEMQARKEDNVFPPISTDEYKDNILKEDNILKGSNEAEVDQQNHHHSKAQIKNTEFHINRNKKRSNFDGSINNETDGGSRRRKVATVNDCIAPLFDDRSVNLKSGKDGCVCQSGALQTIIYSDPSQDEAPSSNASKCVGSPATSGFRSLSDSGEVRNVIGHERSIAGEQIVIDQQKGARSKEQSASAAIFGEDKHPHQGQKHHIRKLTGKEDHFLRPFESHSCDATQVETWGEVSSVPVAQKESARSCGSCNNQQSKVQLSSERSLDREPLICDTHATEDHTCKGQVEKMYLMDHTQKGWIVSCPTTRWKQQSFTEAREKDNITTIGTQDQVSASSGEDVAASLGNFLERTGSSIGGCIETGKKQQSHLFKTGSLSVSTASNMHCTRYSGVGFVPYKRSLSNADGFQAGNTLCGERTVQTLRQN